MNGITEKDVIQIYSEEPLTHIYDDKYILQIQRKFLVQIQDSMEDEIVKQVVKTAKNVGITDLVVLNKRVILKALYKEVPRKPIAKKVNVKDLKIGKEIWRKGTTVYKCLTCNSIVTKVDDYCPKCGQAIDWEVENE